ncbi:MAG: GntR family transcriptional regulator [Spirochaetes bacterium]|nr:GntR family transcriptional regulator [Spirochaetota bacterium]
MAKKKYPEVYRLLKEQIQAGRFAAAGRLPGETALLAECGVSKVTLRKAICDLEREGLVHAIPGLGTLLGRRSKASRPAPSAHRRIGALFPPAPSAFALQILGSVKEFCDLFDLELLTEATAPKVETDPGRVAALCEKGLDGLLVFYREGFDGAFMDAVGATRKPCVLVDNFPPAPALDAVMSDNHAAGRELARYFLKLGHRRFFYLNDTDAHLLSTRERLEGFRWELGAAGGTSLAVRTIDRSRQASGPSPGARSFDPELTDALHHPTLLTMEYVRTEWKKAPARQRPTAFIGQNEEAILAILHALRRTGLAIPAQVSVGGIDQLSHPIPGLQPTHLEQDGRALGRHACERLVLRMRQADAPISRLLVPMRLVLGDTDRAIPAP